MKNAIPEWMENEVAAYDIDLVTPPKTILDIGANIGAFSRRCLKRWPEVVIIAYEPAAENFSALERNLPPVAILANGAVRGFTGTDAILRGDMGVNHGFHDLGCTRGIGETVQCYDAAHVPPADLIKIDTEGCELEIVQRLDLSKTTALACEYHLGDWKEIKAIVEAAGLPMFSRQPTSVTHGIMKFARPGTVQPPPGLRVDPIPDSTSVFIKGKDGAMVELKASQIKHPFYRPSLEGKRLFIGLPINREMPTFFADCMYALQAQKPLPLEVHTCQGDGVARSRNGLTSAFLRSTCTHMLMIDCDLVFSADHIVHLLERDVDVVGGFYPKKQEGPLEWVINTLPGNPPCRRDGLQPLKYIGTGFILIKREVFEKMAAAHPELEFAEDYGSKDRAHDFWSMGVYGAGSAERRLDTIRRVLERARRNEEPELNSLAEIEEIATGRLAAAGLGRYLSEDWYFCQRWLDMGGEVWGDSHVTLKHWGPAVYPLKTQIPEMMGNAEPLNAECGARNAEFETGKADGCDAARPAMPADGHMETVLADPFLQTR